MARRRRQRLARAGGCGEDHPGRTQLQKISGFEQHGSYAKHHNQRAHYRRCERHCDGACSADGRSKAHVIEAALRALEERLFWDDVKTAYAELAEDAPSLARYRVEVAEWDETLQDGFNPADGREADR